MVLWLPWLLLTLLHFLPHFVSAQQADQAFFPASRPLAVRSPYFSAWEVSARGYPQISGSWPGFWDQSNRNLGWNGILRVDNVSYTWLGHDGFSQFASNVTSVQITPTRTIFSMNAGPLNFTATFLSPIEPSDFVKQSMPFSYVSIEANSLDGNSHQVQLYADISAEWVSGIRTSDVIWSNANTTSSIYHQVALQTMQPWKEVNDQAQDGTAYHAMSMRPGMMWQINTDAITRNQFVSTGALSNTMNGTFGVINSPYSVFALAVNLGSIQATSSPVTWAVGFVRDSSVQYTNASGVPQSRRPYYTTQYPNDIGTVIDAFLEDFPSAYNRAVALDQKIMGDAANISSNYVDLVSLAARQTMGALDITTSQDANASDVLIFMKDVGVSQRVNPVERMFAAFPMYLYLNASLCGAMLEPLLNAQDNLSGQQYAAQDIGMSYPVASGTRGPHAQGIEQTGNMLTMLYAYARISGDGTLLGKHYPLIKRWGDYLVNNSLSFDGQISADWESAANMTNLAIKGIIGVKAMAEISRALKAPNDAQFYESQASSLLSSWQSLAQPNSLSHLIGSYGNQQSWALMYNIYADRLLGTSIVPQSVLDSQTSYYNALLSQVPSAFGLPIDSNVGTNSSAAWTMFTAATVTDDTVRNQLISSVWSRASNNQTIGAFVDVYNEQTGAVVTGTASPAMGAMFSLLALNLQNTSITSTVTVADSTGAGGPPNTVAAPKGRRSRVGPIVGGIVGSLAVVGIAIAACLVWRRRRGSFTSKSPDGADIFQASYRPAPFLYGDERGTNPQMMVENVSIAGATVPSTFAEANSPAPTPLHHGLPSSKAREQAMNNPYHSAMPSLSSSLRTPGDSTNGDTPFSHSTWTTPDHDTDTTSNGGGTSVFTPSDVVGLRTEVENLRRVMYAMRTERHEPPPEYRSEYGEPGHMS